MWSYILCHEDWEVIITYQKGKTMPACLLERWKYNSSKWVGANHHRNLTYGRGTDFFQRKKIFRNFQFIVTSVFLKFCI